MNKPRECECVDPQCPHVEQGHKGTRRLVFRIDMDDLGGTLMCEPCRFDALDSGLFDLRE